MSEMADAVIEANQGEAVYTEEEMAVDAADAEDIEEVVENAEA